MSTKFSAYFGPNLWWWGCWRHGAVLQAYHIFTLDTYLSHFFTMRLGSGYLAILSSPERKCVHMILNCVWYSTCDFHIIRLSNQLVLQTYLLISFVTQNKTIIIIFTNLNKCFSELFLFSQLGLFSPLLNLLVLFIFNSVLNKEFNGPRSISLGTYVKS